jgi:hypothetical protein
MQENYFDSLPKEARNKIADSLAKILDTNLTMKQKLIIDDALAVFFQAGFDYAVATVQEYLDKKSCNSQ